MGCTVLSGGFISGRMGVNTPSLVFPFTVPTGQDIQDLWVIADLDPEFVAVSYVDTESDVLAVKKILIERGNDGIKLITKIDRPIALATFDTILEVSDGIMVARGDLGVEIEIAEGALELPAVLFGEDQGRYLLALPETSAAAVLERAAAADIPAQRLGRTGGKGLTVNRVHTISIADLRRAHAGWLPAYMASPTT